MRKEHRVKEVNVEGGMWMQWLGRRMKWLKREAQLGWAAPLQPFFFFATRLAREILVPPAGIEPALPALEGWCLNH